MLAKSAQNKPNVTASTPDNSLDQKEIFEFEDSAIDMSDVVTPKNETPTKQEISQSNYVDADSYVELEPEQNNESTRSNTSDPAYQNKRDNNSSPQSSVATIHIVSQGETLFAIAQSYGVKVEDIALWNNLDLNIPLKIGQELRIVESTSQKAPLTTANSNPTDKTSDEFIIHKVNSNETLYSIARKYDVSIKELMEWNHKEDFNIKVDEELKIKKK